MTESVAPESVPEWAWQRVEQIGRDEFGSIYGRTSAIAQSFARHIAEVSNAASQVFEHFSDGAQHDVRVAPLAPFIQPRPVDPLAEAVEEVLAGFENKRHAKQYADAIRLKLAKRGIELAHAGES